MKMKSFRFAAVAAVLLAFCLVFAAPVGATLQGTGTTEDPFLINTEDDLFEFQEKALTGGLGDVTLKLTDNIVFTKPWTPISWSYEQGNLLTINGENKNISNLSNMLLSGTWAGKTSVIINDLTIAKSNIVEDKDDAKGNVGVGAFIGFPQASATITLKNCHLIESTVTGGHWTGGLIGYAAGYAGNDGPVFMTLTIDGCSVQDSGISGKGSAGGIIGHATGNGWTRVDIKNTEVSGNTITSTGSSDNKAGSIMGTVGAAGSSTTANGETKTGGVYVSSCTITENTVKSNTVENSKVYGRQGTIGGVLYVTSKIAVSSTGEGTVTVSENAIGRFNDNGETNGDTVTITATPAEGYLLDSLSVTGQYTGTTISVTNNQFTMPCEPVSISATWKELPKEVVPSVGVDVEVTDTLTTIDTTLTGSTTVDVEKSENKVTITDTSTNVKIEVEFTNLNTETVGEVSGSVSGVTVTYPKNDAPSASNNEDTQIKQEVSFELVNVTTELPKIDSTFDSDKADKVTEKFPNHKPLAMITATNADKVNANMTKGEKTVTVKFTLPKSLVQSLVGDNYNLLKAYHIKADGSFGDVDISIDPSSDPIVITVKGSGFSSYVIGYEEPEEEEIVSNGGGKDTGSGNYQYYPRDVPTNGIVDFGTSKVITGMELPAGSSGKVTLNTKPTFAMPENGFYAFEIDAPGYNLDAKINGGLSFQIPLADLEEAGYTEKDIVLFHGTVAEDGKITWEALPTNLVKNENGIAYYKSAINGCSPFYIGFVKDGSVVNTEVVEPVTPPTDEPQDVPGEVLPEIPDVQDEPETPATPAPLFAVLAALGAAVVLRRK